MPRRPDLPVPSPELIRRAAGREGIITTAEAMADGISKSQLEALCRHRGWLRMGRGAYLLGIYLNEDGPTVAQQVWAAVVVTPGRAVVVGTLGWSLHGLMGAPLSDTVELALPTHAATRHQPKGRTLTWCDIAAGDVVSLEGLPVACIRWLLQRALPRHPREVVVSMLDSALHHERIDDADLAWLRERAPRDRQGWIDLADGRAESPLETRLRLLVIDAGIPPDDVNHRVRKGKQVVARIDLVWFRRGLLLAVEADGVGPHSQPTPLFKDRKRQSLLNSLGWTVIRYTWSDVVGRPAYVLDDIRRHLLLSA